MAAAIFNPGTGTDIIVAGSGNDTINLAAGNPSSGDIFNGRNGTDANNLTNAGVFNFTGVTIANIENLTSSSGNLNQTVTLSGAQANGFNSINLGNGYDILNLTSDGLQALSNRALQGVEQISAASAGAGVSIDLHNQSSTENFTVYGSDFNDTLTGGAGIDTINGGADKDTIDGRAGDDQLNGQDDDDILNGGDGKDKLDGGNGNDTLDGGVGDDDLKGQDGDDILIGGAGNDNLEGGDNTDVLYGGAGRDVMRGGADANIFRFDAGDSTNALRDIIKDFQQGVDKIDLVSLLGGTDLVFGGTTPTVDGVWYRQSDGNTHIYADINGNTVAELVIQLNGRYNLLATDFLGVSTVVVNHAPVAVADSYSTAEDTALVIAAAGVLSNDSDGDGDPLTSLLVSGPSNGTLTLNANGSFTYTPNANYNGPDSFSYKANDGTADSNIATVSLTVTAANDAPVNTVPGAQSVNEDTNLSIAGLSINDVDAGSATNILTTLSVAHGTLTVLAAGGAAVSGSGTGLVTLTGTVAQINTTLAAASNVVYKGVQDFNGSDTLTVLTAN